MILVLAILSSLVLACIVEAWMGEAEVGVWRKHYKGATHWMVSNWKEQEK